MLDSSSSSLSSSSSALMSSFGIYRHCYRHHYNNLQELPPTCSLFFSLLTTICHYCYPKLFVILIILCHQQKYIFIVAGIITNHPRASLFPVGSSQPIIIIVSLPSQISQGNKMYCLRLCSLMKRTNNYGNGKMAKFKHCIRLNNLKSTKTKHIWNMMWTFVILHVNKGVITVYISPVEIYLALPPHTKNSSSHDSTTKYLLKLTCWLNVLFTMERNVDHCVLDCKTVVSD